MSAVQESCHDAHDLGDPLGRASLAAPGRVPELYTIVSDPYRQIRDLP